MKKSTEVKMEYISNIINNHETPELQRLLDKIHINGMLEDQIEEYGKKKTFSILQSFTIARTDNNIDYLLDGQHRIVLFSKLRDNGYNIDNILVPVVIYHVKDYEEVEYYFNKINKHSPIKPIGNMVSHEKKLCQLLLNKFTSVYLRDTKEGATCNCPHISLNELADNIKVRNIQEKLQNSNKNINDLYNTIIDVNTFLDKISNTQLDPDLYKKFNDCKNKKRKIPCDTCYLGIYRRFEWLDLSMQILFNNENINDVGPKYLYDIMSNKKRIKIPWCLKEQVWSIINNKDSNVGKCYTCNRNDLKYSDMECGHIIAHAFGGTTALENMMPVCKKCNRDMGVMNMNEYKKLIP
jgi:hypothetical protein